MSEATKKGRRRADPFCLSVQVRDPKATHDALTDAAHYKVQQGHYIFLPFFLDFLAMVSLHRPGLRETWFNLFQAFRRCNVAASDVLTEMLHTNVQPVITTSSPSSSTS